MNPYDTPTDGDSPRAPNKLHTAVTVVLVASAISAFVLVVVFGPFVWIVRDGLGPGSIESHGWAAVQRAFWTFYWGPATLGVTSVWLAAFVFRRRSQ